MKWTHQLVSAFLISTITVSPAVADDSDAVSAASIISGATIIGIGGKFSRREKQLADQDFRHEVYTTVKIRNAQRTIRKHSLMKSVALKSNLVANSDLALHPLPGESQTVHESRLSRLRATAEASAAEENRLAPLARKAFLQVRNAKKGYRNIRDRIQQFIDLQSTRNMSGKGRIGFITTGVAFLAHGAVTQADKLKKSILSRNDDDSAASQACLADPPPPVIKAAGTR